MNITVPPWQPDTDAQYCPICQNAFTLFYRRHHCRICGRVVCGSCSQSFIPYPPETYVLPPSQFHAEPAGTLLRTCDDCIREPSHSSSPSYSSFPSATIASRHPQAFPPLRGSRSLTSQSASPPSLFSKGSTINPTVTAVDVETPSTSASASDAAAVIQRTRALSNASRRLHSRHRPTPSSSSSAPTRELHARSATVSTTITISPTPSSSSLATIASAPPEAKPSRLSSAFRFIGYGASSKASESSKDSTVEYAAPSTPPPSQGTQAHTSGVRFLTQNHPAPEDDDDNLCPICGFNLITLKLEEEREAHINNCLANGAFMGSPEHRRRNRMVVYKLPESHAGKECVICFEEFEKDDIVARLECLCVYHRKCIKQWFDKKGAGECPIHSVHQ